VDKKHGARVILDITSDLTVRSQHLSRGRGAPNSTERSAGEMEPEVLASEALIRTPKHRQQNHSSNLMQVSRF